MGKILGIFWKNFFEIWENFFEICTTVYKAGLSKVGDLYNLVTKNITKYPVPTTFKILKIKKKLEMFFFVILRTLKVVRTGYFVTFFVTRLYKSPTVLKPALYTVVMSPASGMGRSEVETCLVNLYIYRSNLCRSV